MTQLFTYLVVDRLCHAHRCRVSRLWVLVLRLLEDKKGGLGLEVQSLGLDLEVLVFKKKVLLVILILIKKVMTFSRPR